MVFTELIKENTTQAKDGVLIQTLLETEPGLGFEGLL